jgi:hypothetical protein
LQRVPTIDFRLGIEKLFQVSRFPAPEDELVNVHHVGCLRSPMLLDPRLLHTIVASENHNEI